MGNFRIVIDAIGGHGQDRVKKDGETVDFTNPEYPSENTPERILQKAVQELKEKGCSVQSAKVYHWPNSEMATPVDGTGKECITDDLITGVRKGSF